MNSGDGNSKDVKSGHIEHSEETSQYPSMNEDVTGKCGGGQSGGHCETDGRSPSPATMTLEESTETPSAHSSDFPSVDEAKEEEFVSQCHLLIHLTNLMMKAERPINERIEVIQGRVNSMRDKTLGAGFKALVNRTVTS